MDGWEVDLYTLCSLGLIPLYSTLSIGFDLKGYDGITGYGIGKDGIR